MCVFLFFVQRQASQILPFFIYLALYTLEDSRSKQRCVIYKLYVIQKNFAFLLILDGCWCLWRFYCSNLFAWWCLVCFHTLLQFSLSDPFQINISTFMRSVTFHLCVCVFLAQCLFCIRNIFVIFFSTKDSLHCLNFCNRNYDSAMLKNHNIYFSFCESFKILFTSAAIQ